MKSNRTERDRKESGTRSKTSASSTTTNTMNVEREVEKKDVNDMKVKYTVQWVRGGRVNRKSKDKIKTRSFRRIRRKILPRISWGALAM